MSDEFWDAVSTVVAYCCGITALYFFFDFLIWYDTHK